MGVQQYFRARKKFAKIGLLENLVFYLPFDINNTDLVDNISPSGIGGLNLTGAGIISNSLTWNGSTNNASITYADRDRFSFTDGSNDVPFSISFWVFISSFSSSNNLLFMKRQESTTNSEYQCFTGNAVLEGSGRKYFFWLFSNLGITNYLQVESISNCVTDTWTHIVITYNGSKSATGLKMYLNGQIDSNSNMIGTYAGVGNGISRLSMMNLDFARGANFVHRGRIDEYAIWKNRELSAADVTLLYNSGNGLQYPF